MKDFQKFIQTYISNYDFKESFRLNYEKLIANQYYEKNMTNIYIDFVDTFWRLEYVKVSQLKNDFKISGQLSYKYIIKAFRNKIFVDLLYDYWINLLDIFELAKKYKKFESYLEEIILNVYIDNSTIKENNDDRWVCPKCEKNMDFNYFIIQRDNLNNKFLLQCPNCREKYYDWSLLSKLQQDKSYSKNILSIEEFDKKILDIDNRVKEKYCPICKEQELGVIEYYIKQNYIIKCNNCDNFWESYVQFDIIHKEFQKKAAMMISIKEREEKLIRKKKQLANKNNLHFIKENLITQDENNNYIKFIKEISKNRIKYWNYLYNNIKKCNQGEINLLKIIMEEFQDSNNVEELPILLNDNGQVITYLSKINYKTDEPIIEELKDKTKMLNIRNLIRNLIDKKLIGCSEEYNYILIDPIILKRKDKIYKSFQPQNIKAEIKYLVHKRNSYTCYNCGAEDKLLKIAYLNKEKNMNDLNSMVSLCNICFPQVTKDEIMIDGAITSLDLEYKKDDYISWQFLNIYLPLELRNELKWYKRNEDLIIKYGEETLIKAYAETIFNLIEKKGGISVLKGFFNYAQAVLENNKEIVLSEEVKNQYEIEEWVQKL